MSTPNCMGGPDAVPPPTRSASQPAPPGCVPPVQIFKLMIAAHDATLTWLAEQTA